MNLKEKLKRIVAWIKEKISILYFVTKNPNTPLFPKMLVLFALAFALSPLDLIPDFIPILGFIDDFILLPLIIFIAYQFIPKAIWEDSVQKARTNPLPPLPKNNVAAVVIILLWVLVIVYLIYTYFHKS